MINPYDCDQTFNQKLHLYMVPTSERWNSFYEYFQEHDREQRLYA